MRYTIILAVAIIIFAAITTIISATNITLISNIHPVQVSGAPLVMAGRMASGPPTISTTHPPNTEVRTSIVILSRLLADI